MVSVFSFCFFLFKPLLGYLNYFDTETVVAVGTGDVAVTGVALSAENKNHAHKNSVCLNSSGVNTIQDFFESWA